MVEPVKLTFRMAGCSISALLIAAGSPYRREITSPGTPASRKHRTSSAGDPGVSSAALMTIEQPAARAAESFLATHHVLAALEPIWTTKTETASRVRSRVEAVLDLAIARGSRVGLNPAWWKGHLAMMLPSPKKIAKEEHHSALLVKQLGTFTKALGQVPGTGSKALRFATLTAARSGEVRGATWSEFDLEARLWTIPAARMKGGVEHRVPLSPAALKLVGGQPRVKGTDIVFASSKGRQISDMTMSKVMRGLNFKDVKGNVCVPHGMRSTFRDWCADHTDYPRELAQMALAHKIPDKPVNYP